ncbi:MAG: PLP-dependent aminotransferase family protein [Chloroflexota bacterium]|nr:PLP-dependent aminotransferase family protein [Chloroflexota bacterium]
MSTTVATASTTAAPALARRTAGFAPSFWAGLEKLFGRHPDMIFFGGGTPARELIPVERLRAAAARAWEDAPGALDYGEVAGYRPLRELIATRMALQGMTVDPDHLLVTNGSQQGIDLVARLLLDPGDAVVVEAPTFLGAFQTFAAYEATYLPVPLDDDGLQIDALERVLAKAPRPPKLLYTIPTFQNPSGVTLSRPRREALLAVARAHNLVVVEDDPYGELRYGGESVPPLRALDPGVLYLGTFSKTIAPGLRVGWVAAPDSLVPLLHSAKEGVDIHNERITARTVFHAASGGFLDDHLTRARAVYRDRRDVLLAALRDQMPAGVRWSEPEGGFFVWVTLPEGQDAAAILPRAAERGVTFLPGAWFSPPTATPDPRTLRLNFSTLPEERIVEGVRRFGEVLGEG